MEPKPIEYQIEALARLKEISDQIVGLRTMLEMFPANQYVIDNLLLERKNIMKEYIFMVHAYP